MVVEIESKDTVMGTTKPNVDCWEETSGQMDEEKRERTCK